MHASIMPTVKSETALAFLPAAFTTLIPWAVAASRSTFSIPPRHTQMVFRLGIRSIISEENGQNAPIRMSASRFSAMTCGMGNEEGPSFSSLRTRFENSST